MQKPNIFPVGQEELIERTKERLNKLISFDFKPYLGRLAIGWLVFLAMLFSLISTITLALTLWP